MLASDKGIDQAAGLRRIAQPKPVRVLAVTSGKGGVGKTNVSVNLALAMVGRGHDTLLLDADLGLANCDVMLGLHPKRNISNVVNGDCSLEEVIIEGPSGLKVIPAASGIKQMAELSPMVHAGLVRAFSEIGPKLDVLVVDTAAGISDSVVSFVGAAQEVLVVVCDEPASITDAYALIKLLSREHGISRFHIVANMAKSLQEGRELYAKMAKVTDRFLEVNMDFMGVVPFDDYLRKAVQKQRAVMDVYPRSRAAAAFKNLAQAVDSWPMPEAARGNLEFFVERLVQPAAGAPQLVV